MKKLTKEQTSKMNNPDPNHVIIKFDYGRAFVFPHAAGVQIIDLFQHAEYIDSEDYDNPVIISVPSTKAPELRLMSHQEYTDKKMSHILGVKIRYGEEIANEK